MAALTRASAAVFLASKIFPDLAPSGTCAFTELRRPGAGGLVLYRGSALLADYAIENGPARGDVGGERRDLQVEQRPFGTLSAANISSVTLVCGLSAAVTSCRRARPEHPMRGQVPALVDTIHGRHIEQQVLNATCEQPFGGPAREVGRRRVLGVAARGLGRVIKHSASARTGTWAMAIIGTRL